MKRIWLGSSCFVRVTFLLISVQLGIQPSMAKKPALDGPIDFQIMVNGSWSYVTEPNPNHDPSKGGDTSKRIVLVAPSHPSHKAYIFPGPNAATTAPTGEIAPGLYYLDIPGRTFKGQRQTGEDVPHAYSVGPTVDSAKIQKVIYNYNSNHPRYAISLPVPDYYSTYGNGTAESKIDSGDPSSILPGIYTIWMVLHYQVSSPASSLNESLYRDDGSLQSNFPLSASANAISVVDRAAGSLNQKNCDTYSIYSFDHTMDLWDLPLNARFPEETAGAVGGQIHGYYHPECPLQDEEPQFAAKQKAFEKAVRCSRITFNQINSLRKTFGLISKGTKAEQFDGNGKDCEVEKSPIIHISSAISDLSFGMISNGMRKDLACLQELINKEYKTKDCRTDLARKDLIEYEVQNAQSIVNIFAIGSTDCHAAQISINSAIP